jgi:hypothetical protein
MSETKMCDTEMPETSVSKTPNCPKPVLVLMVSYVLVFGHFSLLLAHSTLNDFFFQSYSNISDP